MSFNAATQTMYYSLFTISFARKGKRTAGRVGRGVRLLSGLKLENERSEREKSDAEWNPSLLPRAQTLCLIA